VRVDAIPDDALESTIRSLVAEAPADAVMTIRVTGALTEHAARVLSAANLRRMAPASMNVELRMEERGDVKVGPAVRSQKRARMPELPLQ
jgi:hypothetical protein